MYRQLPTSLIVGFAGVLLLAVAWKHPQPAAAPGPRPGPQTLREARTIAESLRLHARSDARNEQPTGKLLLSERPLTFEQAVDLNLHDPLARGWAGTVAVLADGEAIFDDNVDPAHPGRAVLWGTLFLYGDPATIQRLLAATPQAAAPHG